MSAVVTVSPPVRRKQVLEQNAYRERQRVRIHQAVDAVDSLAAFQRVAAE